jgi:hypothetical protein
MQDGQELFPVDGTRVVVSGRLQDTEEAEDVIWARAKGRG